ncbi:hypothetical protein ABIE67_009550 [Streptomyces sp. V4I8]|uniref:pentapeptide repeat-containing protein n=1 Tax=Streptomyces sp. V4I8 TaxID=3156469 RepID=UPI0035123C13
MTSAADPPDWPHCGDGADLTAGDPIGCRGRRVEPYAACLAHLAADQRDTYLAALAPGSDLDHRGTELAEPLLQRLLDAVCDSDTQGPRIGNASFGWATFTGDARFSSATFLGDASFPCTIFAGDASFYLATFTGKATFGSATFHSDASFGYTTFAGDASFVLATFTGYTGFYSATFTGYTEFTFATFADDARFDSATFTGSAIFRGTTFTRKAHFDSTTFTDTAWFESAVFERSPQIGPLVCGGELDLSSASFGGPVTVEAAARRVVCHRTRWSSSASLRLRYAEVDFTDAVFEYPLSIAAHPRRFALPEGGVLEETSLSGVPATARMLSLQGVDAAHMVLTEPSPT